MKFDWKRFCDDYGIPYVTSGPSTTRGNISIKCVYCGQADPSEHLGLKLDISDPAWNCWRNSQHSGRSPRRLVQKLLGCSYNDAMSVVVNQLVASPEQEELDRATDAMRTSTLTKTKTPVPAIILDLPAEFKPLNKHAQVVSRYGDMFIDYLAVNRGFGTDAVNVVNEFNLRYALIGEFAWRLIIPFYAKGQLIGWTGRDIRRNPKRRYHTRGNKNMIFNADSAQGRTLLITEGPMDAIKLHHYGRTQGYAAVATLGTAITPEQKSILARIIRQCENAVILFDRDTLAAGMPLAEELESLSSRPVRSRFLREYADPGDIPPDAVLQVCEEVSVA